MSDSLRAPAGPRVVYDSRGCRLILDYFPPVAILTLGADAGKDDYVGLLDAVERHVFTKREPYIIITDSRGTGRPPSADIRKLIGDWMKKHEKGNTSLGSVTIISSPVIRGALTALYWLFEPPTPQGVVSTWEEARDWTVEKLRDARVPPPPKLVAARTQPY